MILGGRTGTLRGQWPLHADKSASAATAASQTLTTTAASNRRAVSVLFKVQAQEGNAARKRMSSSDGADFSLQEVKNRWRLEIRGRLDLDRRMTHRKYEKRALPEGLVEATWRPVILGHESLPPGWVGNSGVLVGIKGG
ncbi:hypothetical protein FB107DRAFT_224349 [Schizophyllum commune]